MFSGYLFTASAIRLGFPEFAPKIGTEIRNAIVFFPRGTCVLKDESPRQNTPQAIAAGPRVVLPKLERCRAPPLKDLLRSRVGHACFIVIMVMMMAPALVTLAAFALAVTGSRGGLRIGCVNTGREGHQEGCGNCKRGKLCFHCTYIHHKRPESRKSSAPPTEFRAVQTPPAPSLGIPPEPQSSVCR